MNQVKKILTERGFKTVQLTDETLMKLGVETPHRFNKIWHNEAEMTQSEMIAFKKWLRLKTVDELITSEEEEVFEM